MKKFFIVNKYYIDKLIGQNSANNITVFLTFNIFKIYL